MVKFNNSWDELLKDEWNQQYYSLLKSTLKAEYAEYIVYPKKDDIFNAFKETGYEDIKVVILGQDPYHGRGQGHGFAFSVCPGVKIPPSLKNMYKELNADIGTYIPNNGYLLPWAKQGVFLLNAVLTVREGDAGSHAKIGWHTFTDHVIQKLNERKKPIIFVLWGNFALRKEELITNPQHIILRATHPSPLSASRGFFGCKHFSQINEILIKHGQEPINWQIENI